MSWLRTPAVLPDGRLLGVQQLEVEDEKRGETPKINIVINWSEELKSKVAAP